jgi:hypothetical protein
MFVAKVTTSDTHGNVMASWLAAGALLWDSASRIQHSAA